MKTIVCSYTNDCKFGFGDFLRGSSVVRSFCIKNKIAFQIDYSKHDIGKYVKSNYSGPVYSCDDVKKHHIYDSAKIKEYFKNSSYYYVCSNQAPYPTRIYPGQKIPITKHTKKDNSIFFSRNLNFCEKLKKDAEQRLSDKNIKEFNLFHARVGDEYCFSDGLGYSDPKITSNKTPYYVCLDDYVRIFYDLIIKNKKANNIIISDSSEFKNKLNKLLIEKKNQNSHVLTFSSAHTSKAMLEMLFDTPKEGSIYETMMEMYLVSLSSRVVSVSSYSINSNFVNSLTETFKIPITNYKASRYLESNI
jgi:hypothetical protein